ncbi:MAG TPA: choice-of-anchor tandem repeat GloVer-containing protein [Terriglobales bacterium]|jgi:uncharacterized repeat protein (TIGR03803 family)|nr:choice-of-anchor tandem repeat GloVer-containing protein [Terriglobales bacterium]
MKSIRIRLAASVAAVCAVAILAAQFAQAQTFKTLVLFNGTDGAGPQEPLLQASDGNFYGTTIAGGSSTNCTGGCGTVFKLTKSGKETVLHSFTGYPTDGAVALGLVQAADRNLYGTTQSGGTHGECAGGGCGTVFRISLTGKPTTLYNFCAKYENNGCADGTGPNGGLIQGKDGNFYGTTFEGGVTEFTTSSGTAFKMTPSGKLTTLYSFCTKVHCTDGEHPASGLVEAVDGDFYGTTAQGGTYGGGTIFKITAAGKLTTLYSFCKARCADGDYPAGALIQATDGDFYGTTELGGSFNCSIYGCGTAFKVTAAGKLTTLHTFCIKTNCPDGAQPTAKLVQATDGNFYGVASHILGTVFKVTPGGTLKVLHTFDITDGLYPIGGLIQATEGSFYGTTELGGDTSTCNGAGCGTVFRLK